jgi:carbonic anhydrase
MCELCATAEKPPSVTRRVALKLAAGAAAGFVVARDALAANAKAIPKPEHVLSPNAALDRLLKGNARYVEGVGRRHDFKQVREALEQGAKSFCRRS